MLPPRMRIVYSEDHSKTPAEQYLGKIDASLQETLQAVANGPADDLVSLVFANQALAHSFKSKHMAQLLSERKELADRHLAAVNEWLEELKSRRPCRPPYGATKTRDRTEQELERQIVDLERQKRDIELTLWRDTTELRREVTEERREYQATRGRLSFLAGGEYGGP